MTHRSLVTAALAAACATLSATAAPIGAQTPSFATDSAAVMSALNGMMQSMRTRDAAGLRAVFHEHARMTLLRPAQDGTTRVVVLTGAQFIDIATNPQQPLLDEPIRNPRIHIDADLATVWAEYQVRINGKVSHCGYDAFHLVRAGGSWKVLNISDTYRPQGCGPMWPD